MQIMIPLTVIGQVVLTGQHEDNMTVNIGTGREIDPYTVRDQRSTMQPVQPDM